MVVKACCNTKVLSSQLILSYRTVGKELGTLPTQLSKDFLPSAFETCGKSGQYHLLLMEAGLRLC